MPVNAIEMEREEKSRVCRCIYCGNAVFAIEDDHLDLKDCPSYLSPKHIINVNMVEDGRLPYDKVVLSCGRCGVSLGHKLIDRSGLVGDRTVVRVNMLQASYDPEEET